MTLANCNAETVSSCQIRASCQLIALSVCRSSSLDRAPPILASLLVEKAPGI